MAKIKKPIQVPKGTFDILPDDQKYWKKVRSAVSDVAQSYGFGRIDTPMFEYSDLYMASVGEATDVVEKQMYSFKSKGGDMLSLRPEGTAGVARAYIENGMTNLPQPVKLYYTGPMFRYEQPQSGRFRQFHQFGLETIGDAEPVLDAQIIQACFYLLKCLGLKKMVVQLNSLGCRTCRTAYRRALVDYYRHRKNKICLDCRRRLKENPLRLLDCKEEKCQPIKAQAPNIVDYLCEECHKHFKMVLEYLDELEIPYFLNNTIVRGLDYYTKTVFEIFTEDEQGKTTPANSLGGGGRYDNLVAQLGGKPTPAVGAALGIERVIHQMQKDQVKVSAFVPKVFLVQLGERGRKKGLKLFEKLSEAGIKIAESISRDSIKAQLKIADRLGAKFALILGQQEALDETVIIRDMATGVQETVPQGKVIDEVKKRLAK